MFQCLFKSMSSCVVGLVMLGGAFTNNSAHAANDTPFHAGVWELIDSSGARSLVMSDWMLFDNNKPKTWLYLKSGSSAEGRFSFLARNLNISGYQNAIIDVASVDEKTMEFRISSGGNVLEQGRAYRLSTPNARESCLAVETTLQGMLGKWITPDKKNRRTLEISDGNMTWSGQKNPIQLQQVRVGQVGIVSNGHPLAILTDAGGDYAVLQFLLDGEPGFTRQPNAAQILSFKEEIVVMRPLKKNNCDAQIARRLKFLGKTKR